MGRAWRRRGIGRLGSVAVWHVAVEGGCRRRRWRLVARRSWVLADLRETDEGDVTSRACRRWAGYWRGCYARLRRFRWWRRTLGRVLVAYMALSRPGCGCGDVRRRASGHGALGVGVAAGGACACGRDGVASSSGNGVRTSSCAFVPGAPMLWIDGGSAVGDVRRSPPRLSLFGWHAARASPCYCSGAACMCALSRFVWAPALAVCRRRGRLAARFARRVDGAARAAWRRRGTALLCGVVRVGPASSSPALYVSCGGQRLVVSDAVAPGCPRGRSCGVDFPFVFCPLVPFLVCSRWLHSVRPRHSVVSRREWIMGCLPFDAVSRSTRGRWVVPRRTRVRPARGTHSATARSTGTPRHGRATRHPPRGTDEQMCHKTDALPPTAVRVYNKRHPNVQRSHAADRPPQ